ncbi:calcium-binding protein [Jannaschia seohaensis]|uniref:Hemolysin type calcium-binding protein n=1 Tax=Jannaschia seohaensis TaxID=475081 RepID=A0A2Y9A0Y0_9RHOB|nr:hypothetical protein [Jannaschia seohaensis]PWJ21822.1 hemolysin type calcium-binding protein [Jannaschia seohaensis]SSA38100.1 Hemolysin-type calcium-binding repeat-containing protein [Jannaschia seohaensis]
MADIFGTETDDRGATQLTGTAQDDLIQGFAGNDELFGLDGNDTLEGGPGNDTLVPGPTEEFGNQRIRPGTGSDRIDLTGSNAFIDIGYFDHPTALTVVLDEPGDFGRVTDGAGDIDTYVDLGRQIRENGIYFATSNFDDDITVTSADRNSYVHIDPEGGNDRITVTGGEGTVRLEFRANGNPGDAGVTIDLATGVVTSPNGDEDIILIEAPQRRLQIQTGHENDSITGSATEDEQYIWRGGNDTIDGVAGFDMLRMDDRRVSDVDIDLADRTATARYEGQAFQISLDNIDGIAGSNDDGDELRGDDGENYIEGRDGNDTIEGRDGDDDLRGDNGNDLIDGGGGENRLRGGEGNDTLISGPTNDDIDAGNGNDRIDLTAMVEGWGGFIQPGLGQDTLLGSQALWDAGEGHDLSYRPLGGVSGLIIEVGANGTGTARSGDGQVNDSFSFFHYFNGSQDDDRITSVDEADDTFRFEAFSGNGGNDTIIGGENGFDVLSYRDERFDNDNVQAVTVNFATGVAIDTFGDQDRFSGIEQVQGTFLADTFIGSNSQEIMWFRGYDGADTIQGAELVEEADGTLLGFETADYLDDAGDGGTAGVVVDLAAGTGRDGFGNVDTLIQVDAVRGTLQNDVMRGTETYNDLRGEAGDDLLEGRGGNDFMRGGDGNDTLDGGAGRDRMEGGTGDDIYIVDSARDSIFDEGGVDEIRTSVNFGIVEGIEQLTATGRGNIRLDGSERDETLVGNAGANILVGLGGADVMTGGRGADSFVLTARGGTDPNVLVTDWERGRDRLAIDDQLVGLGARGIAIRELGIDDFRTLRDSGSVGYNARNGELRLDIDGDGDRELVATLEGGARLGLDDILLF